MAYKGKKIKIGISSCLLGEKVRYDGGHKLDRFITGTLGRYFEWVPVCPESEYGLPVPREALRLTGDSEAPHLVTIKTGVDHTRGMLRWVRKKLAELETKNLSGFIFKSKSPSSGIGGVKIYDSTDMSSRTGTGSGIFGGAFIKRFPLIPVEDEERVHNTALRENFIERVFVFRRWQKFRRENGSVKNLMGFHTSHKLQILAHSPRHYTTLEHLMSDGKQRNRRNVLSKYIEILTEGMCLTATVKKHINVMMHILGYFKKNVSSDEKLELSDAIDNYRKGLVPWIVPVTLIRHYIRRFDIPYLKRQYYLYPHPLELMLRNHV